MGNLQAVSSVLVDEVCPCDDVVPLSVASKIQADLLELACMLVEGTDLTAVAVSDCESERVHGQPNATGF